MRGRLQSTAVRVYYGVSITHEIKVVHCPCHQCILHHLNVLIAIPLVKVKTPVSAQDILFNTYEPKDQHSSAKRGAGRGARYQTLF